MDLGCTLKQLLKSAIYWLMYNSLSSVPTIACSYIGSTAVIWFFALWTLNKLYINVSVFLSFQVNHYTLPVSLQTSRRTFWFHCINITSSLDLGKAEKPYILHFLQRKCMNLALDDIESMYEFGVRNESI